MAIDLTTLPQFDAGTLNYDIERYPFDKWVLEHVRAAGYKIDDLTRLHEVIRLEDLPALTKRLIREAGEREFMDMFRAFVDEYIAPMVGSNELAIQRYPNIRAVLPGRPEMRLPVHQGIWVGHGMGEGTMWTPITRAFDTNSMYIANLADSREFTLRAMREKWSKPRMEEEFKKIAKPCNYEPGQSCTFTEANMHGNYPNETGVTRMSIDFRFLQKGGQFFWKPPGGYWVVPGTYDPEGDARRAAIARAGKGDRERAIISYCENHGVLTRGAAIPLQRYAIKEYCEARDLKFRYEHVELIGLTHSPILRGLIEQDRPTDIIMFSIYALPIEADARKAVLEAAADNGVMLHFVNEGEILTGKEDIERIEKIYSFSEDYSSPMEPLIKEIAASA